MRRLDGDKRFRNVTWFSVRWAMCIAIARISDGRATF